MKEVSVVFSDGTPTILGPVKGKALEAKLRVDGLEGRIYADISALPGSSATK